MFSSKNRGFTLIELLVVISIMGLLSSVVLSAVNDARTKARDTERIQELAEMRKALMLYYDDNGKYPTPRRDGTYTASPAAAASTSSFTCVSPIVASWGCLMANLNASKVYLTTLPVDPINTASAFTSGYNYVYRVNLDGSQYDLNAKFETNHPLRCALKQWVTHVGIGVVPIGGVICPTYSNNLYSDHH